MAVDDVGDFGAPDFLASAELDVRDGLSGLGPLADCHCACMRVFAAIQATMAP